MTNDENWEHGTEALFDRVEQAEEGDYLEIGLEGLEGNVMEGEVTTVIERDDGRVVYLHTGNVVEIDGDEITIHGNKDDHDWV